MGSLEKARIKYPEALNAAGRFIAKRGLQDICLMEFENGIVVVGSVLYETAESYNRRIETHVLSIEDLKRLMKEV